MTNSRSSSASASASASASSDSAASGGSGSASTKDVELLESGVAIDGDDTPVAADSSSSDLTKTMDDKGEPGIETDEQRRARRLYESWFFAAYFSAGFSNATKVLLGPFFLERGVSEFFIGIFNSLDDIPVVLRIPFGVASDYFDTTYGKRRPYIFVGCLLAAVFYIGMGIVDVSGFSFWPFGLLFFGASCAHEIWDNQMDAYANEVVPINKVGRTQGMVMAGSRALALIVGFGVVTVLGEGPGWIGVFILNGILVLLPIFWIPKIKEPTGRDPFNPRALAEFKRPEVAAHALFVFFGAIPTAINTVLGTLLATKLEIGPGLLAGILILGAVIFLIGAIYFGLLIDRHRGRMKLLFVLVMSSGLIALLFFTLAAAFNNGVFLFGWTIFVGIAGGALLAVNFSLMMLEVRDLTISGSFFAIMQTIQRGGGLIGSVISGALSQNVGFAWTGVITMSFVFLQFPILHFMFRNVDYSKTAMMTTAVIDGDLIDLQSSDDGHTAAASKSTASTSDDEDEDDEEEEPEQKEEGVKSVEMSPQAV